MDVDAVEGRDAPTAASEMYRILAAGLDGMPCLTRTVYLLHRMDDQPYDAIAWRCGISVDEVVLRMADALGALRRSYHSEPTFSEWGRRTLLPWRFAWFRWCRQRQDRELGL